MEIRQVKVQDVDSIINLLQELDFPVSKREVLDRVGKVELQWSEEELIMLDDVITEIPQNSFESLSDLTDAVCSVIRLSYGDYSAQNQAPILKGERRSKFMNKPR